MNTLEGIKINNLPYGNAIKADADGKLPSKIAILTQGAWRTPYHGDFMITPDNLQRYVDNFTAGTGLADGGSAGAPIDFSHENEKLAAGWIKSLETDGVTLFGNVKWSKAGKEALLNDEYKFFSPEFYPQGRGGWMDPEDYEHVVDDVLTGGGLTNIPLFKTLGALKASAAGGHQEHRTSEVYINASELIEKEPTMTTAERIAELRKADVANLTEDDKTFITASVAEMSDEDKNHFGLDGGISAAAQAALDNKNNKGEEMDKETAQIAADIKAGKSVVISASAYKKMQDESAEQTKKVDELRRAAVEASIDTHIARGAIKADRKSKWADRIMSDATMAEELEALPSNGIMADAAGSSKNAGDATQAADVELHQKTTEAIKAAAAQGKDVSYTEARRSVLASNTELANKINQGE